MLALGNAQEQSTKMIYSIETTGYNVNRIFSVSEEDVNRLSPEYCVRLFGDLLHSDARRMRLSISKVHFTSRTVSDGGIDASVEDGIQEQGDLIIDPESFYQIKSGTTFAPWKESEVRRELLNGKDALKENLGSEVRRCFERNGMYILVCMKLRMTTRNKTDTIENLKKIFGECGISNPKIKVFDQEQIIGIVQSYPSLVLSLTNRDGSVFESHREWETRDDMQKELVMGSEQDQFVKTVRNILLDDSKPVHLNVYGETGVGKTRLVLESTSDPFLLPLVVYCRSPKNCIDSPLLSELVRNDSLSCILVVDDCDYEERAEIWNRLKNLGPRIKLVTIHNELRRTPGTTEQKQAPNLDDRAIQQIILAYHPDDIIADQLSRLCGGIPRVAHVMGWDLQNNPSQLLGGSHDTYDVWGRYINYGDDPKSDHVKQRKKILFTIALFKKFGNIKHFQDEFSAMHNLVCKIDPNIDPFTFKEHVKEMQRRKILQGEDVLYISPEALRLWSWINWWESYGDTFNLADIAKDLPAQLRRWFFATFEYASSSDTAKSAVKELFEENGPLHDSDPIRTELGSEFFRTLSFVDPRTATKHLERTIGSWTKEELKNFHRRRNVLDGLGRIVFEPDLFLRGGRILRDLAECENENWLNNATGLFANLFSLGYGYASATKTPPEERIPLLKQTLCDTSEEVRELGFKACESALQATGVTVVPESGDGLWVDRKGWEPKTDDEWDKAHRTIIDVMVEKIPALPQKEQRKCAEIVFKNSRDVLHSAPNLGLYVTGKLQELEKFVAKETALQEVITILELDREELQLEVRSMLEQIRDNITGSDYPARMRRYVGMGMVVDLVGKDRRREKSEEIKRLARESLEIEKLEPQLHWLVTLDAKSGYEFGYELSALDANRILLDTILDSQKNAGQDGSAFFLSGYMRKIFESNKGLWTEIMESLSEDKAFVRFFSEVAWRSGITDKIGEVMLELVRKNKIEAGELAQFCVGGAIDQLSASIVEEWIRTMLASEQPNVVSSAVGLFYMYFIHRQDKTLNAELTLELLLHKVFFDKRHASAHNPMVDYYWEETVMKFIRQYPEKSLTVAAKMLDGMGYDVPIANIHSQSIKVLDRVAAEQPNEVWDAIARFIDLPIDERGYAIINWVRGRRPDSKPSFIQLVDFEKIFDWIDHDPHSRAPFMARYSPPNLGNERCLAREILVRYGQEDSVQRNLLANFHSGGFSGLASEHYQGKKDEVLRYKKTEDNENVNRWIDLYVDSLDAYIQREKLDEERDSMRD